GVHPLRTEQQHQVAVTCVMQGGGDCVGHSPVVGMSHRMPSEHVEERTLFAVGHIVSIVGGVLARGDHQMIDMDAARPYREGFRITSVDLLAAPAADAEHDAQRVVRHTCGNLEYTGHAVGMPDGVVNDCRSVPPYHLESACRRFNARECFLYCCRRSTEHQGRRRGECGI